MATPTVKELQNLNVVYIRSKDGKPFHGLLSDFQERGMIAYTISNIPVAIDRARRRDVKGLDVLCALAGEIRIRTDFTIEELPGFQGIEDLAIICAISTAAEKLYPLQMLIAALSDNLEALRTIFLFAESREVSEMVLKTLTPEQRLSIAATLDAKQDLPCNALKALISTELISFEAICQTFNDLLFGRTPEQFEEQRSTILEHLNSIEPDGVKYNALLRSIFHEAESPQYRIYVFTRMSALGNTRFKLETEAIARQTAEDSSAPTIVRKHIAEYYKASSGAEWAMQLLASSEFQT